MCYFRESLLSVESNSLEGLIVNSEVQICFQSKRSVSGRKAFLKSVGLWNEQKEPGE